MKTKAGILSLLTGLNGHDALNGDHAIAAEIA